MDEADPPSHEPNAPLTPVREAGGVDANTAAIGLALLLDGIPDARFLESRAEVRDAIREVYRRSGVEPPAWLGEIVP